MSDDELLKAQQLSNSIDNGSTNELKSLLDLAHQNPKIFIKCEKYFQMGIDLKINLNESMNDLGIISMLKNEDPTQYFKNSYELNSENGRFDYALYTKNLELLKNSADKFNNSFSMLFYYKLSKDVSYLKRSALEFQNPFALILYGLYLFDNSNENEAQADDESEEESENDWQSILTQGALLTKPGDKFNLLPFPSILYYDKDFVNWGRNNIKRAADIGNPHNAFLYAYMIPDPKVKAFYYRLAGDLGLTEGYYQYCQLIQKNRSLFISEQYQSIPQKYFSIQANEITQNKSYNPIKSANETEIVDEFADENFSKEMESFINYQNSIFDVTTETVPIVAQKLVETVNDVKSIYNVIHNIMLAIDYRPYESNLHALANLATSLHFMIIDESLQNLFKDLIIQESCANTTRNRSRFYFLEICIGNFMFTMDYLCRAAYYMKMHRTENYNRYVELWFPEIRRFMRELNQEDDETINLDYYFNQNNDDEFHYLSFCDNSLISEDFIINNRNFGNPDPYAKAIRKDDIVTLKKLIISTKGMTVNMRIKPSFFELSSMLDKRPSLLCYAAFFNAERCFCYLLENEANLSFYDDECLTVSAYAAAAGSIRILARIEARNELDHQLAAEYAALYHRGKILHRLMQGKTIMGIINEERNKNAEMRREEQLIKQEIKRRQMQQDLELNNILQQQELFLKEQENQNKQRMKMQQKQQTNELERFLINQQKKIQKEREEQEQNNNTPNSNEKQSNLSPNDKPINANSTENHSAPVSTQNAINPTEIQSNTNENTATSNDSTTNTISNENNIDTEKKQTPLDNQNENMNDLENSPDQINDQSNSLDENEMYTIDKEIPEITEKEKELLMGQVNELKMQLSQNQHKTPQNYHESIQNLKMQTTPESTNIDSDLQQSQIEQIIQQERIKQNNEKNLKANANQANLNQAKSNLPKQNFRRYEDFLSSAENKMKINKPATIQKPHKEKPKKRVSFFNKYADLEKERILLEENRRKKQLQEKLERKQEKQKQLEASKDGLMEGLDLPPQLQAIIQSQSQQTEPQNSLEEKVESTQQTDLESNQTDDDFDKNYISTDGDPQVDDIEKIVMNGLLSDFVESLKYIENKITKKNEKIEEVVTHSNNFDEEEEEEEEADDLDEENEDGLPIFDENYQSDDEDDSISTFFRICEMGNSGVVRFFTRKLWQRMLIESIYGINGDTIFTRLASLGNYDMIDELMQREEVKKMLNVANKAGLTPYEIASEIENQDVIDILEYYLDE